MDEIWKAMEESSFGVAIKEKGKAEGEARGKAKGFVSSVQIIWLSRFGAMPADVTTAIQGLSEAQLEKVLALFGKTPTEAEVRAQLGL